jgi:ribosomal protein S6
MSKTTVQDLKNSQQREARLYLASALVASGDLLEHFVNLIKNHGAEIKKSESLGQKQLSYPINKHQSLYLVSVFFTATPATVPAIEADLRQDEQIERALVTTWKADINQPMLSAKGRAEAATKEEKAKTKSHV